MVRLFDVPLFAAINNRLDIDWHGMYLDYPTLSPIPYNIWMHFLAQHWNQTVGIMYATYALIFQKLSLGLFMNKKSQRCFLISVLFVIPPNRVWLIFIIFSFVFCHEKVPTCPFQTWPLQKPSLKSPILARLI